jgi:hypothetical protein
MRVKPPTCVSEASGAISKGETIVAVGVLTLIFVLRWFYINRFRWDSDELQHLHVVWAWASGLLPYRDVFDNHSPLFHWLCAPLFAWLGERPDIVIPMRWLMVPLFLVSLSCVYMLGATLFSPRVGLWAAISTGLFPKYSLLTCEFRTDNLWTTLWLVALVILLTGQVTPKRLFIVGMLLGAAFSVSMKTTFLALTIILAGAGTLVFAYRTTRTQPRAKTSCKSSVVGAVAALAGLAVTPGLFIAFFASKGALGELYYCVIEHNVLPDSNSPLNTLGRLLTTAWILVPIAAIAFVVAGRESNRFRALRKCFFLLTTGFFWPILYGVWTTIMRETQMPGFPTSAIAVSALLIWLTCRFPYCFRTWVPPLLLILIAGLVAPDWTKDACRINRGQYERDFAIIKDVLALTAPGEYVMDAKGEAVFRPRPNYYAFEGFTEARIERRLITNTVPERLVQTRTAVCIPSERLGAAALLFIEHSYVRVANISVVGKKLVPSPDGRVEFDVAIPQRYTLVSRAGPISGILDGMPFLGDRELAAGRHELALQAPISEVLLLWARAWQNGYSPFKQTAR